MPAAKDKPDKEVVAAKKDADKKADAANDAAQDAVKAQADAAEAQAEADAARAQADAARANLTQTQLDKSAEANAPAPVVNTLPPVKADYAEYTIMHTMVELPDGTMRYRGDQVTSKELRGKGSKDEQDACEQRYIEAGAVAKTGDVKFAP